MDTGGIYTITNTVNGKIYVGSSREVDRRLVYHRRDLRGNKHHNRHLQRAWNHYGEVVFVFQIVARCPFDDLEREEQALIDRLGTHDKAKGYNIRPAGNKGCSDETKALISLKKKGVKVWNKGVKTGRESDELRAKKKAAMTPERKQALREMMRSKFNDPAYREKWFASRFKPESKAKFRETRRKNHELKLGHVANQAA